MHLVGILAGSALVVVALSDIFLTVLFVRGNAALLSPAVSGGVWRIMRWCAHRLPTGGERLLALAGPLVLVVIAVVWATLVLFGFALITWPALGRDILASDGATPRDFGTALYYAGMSLTTLGTGDLSARTSGLRLLMVLKAALGFSLLTLTTTYFMSVYSALVRRNAFASSLHRRTGGTGDSQVLSRALFAGGQGAAAPSVLASLSDGLADLYESHQAYPVLHYFRFPEPAYALSRVAYLNLDLLSLLHAALDAQHYRSLLSGGDARAAWSMGMAALTGVAATFLPSDLLPRAPVEVDADPPEAWRTHFQRARQALAEEGVALAPEEEAWPVYAELRRRWQPWVDALARHMAFDPRVVSGQVAGHGDARSD